MFYCVEFQIQNQMPSPSNHQPISSPISPVHLPILHLLTLLQQILDHIILPVNISVCISEDQDSYIFFNLAKRPLSHIIKYLSSLKFLIIANVAIILKLKIQIRFLTLQLIDISFKFLLSYWFPLHLLFPFCSLLLKTRLLVLYIFHCLNCIPSCNLTCSSVSYK